MEELKRSLRRTNRLLLSAFVLLLIGGTLPLLVTETLSRKIDRLQPPPNADWQSYFDRRFDTADQARTQMQAKLDALAARTCVMSER